MSADLDRLIDRRELLAGMTAVGALGLVTPAMATPSDSLSFLVIGDWGREGSAHQRGVASAMETAAAETGSAFVVAVGDNFYEDGVQSIDDPHWKVSFADVYDGPHLRRLPWYAALGNHDYGGVPQAQVDYSALNPRWKMPARYYAVPGADIGFPALDMFVIDTSPMVSWYRRETNALGANVRSQDADAQLAWLDQALAASRAPCKLVFGHHTMFSGGSTHGDTPDIIARVLPVLKRHGVTAYINGHDHDLQHIVREGMDVVCGGAGSEIRPVRRVDGTQFCVSRSGFTVVTVTSRSVAIEFRDASGAALYRNTIAVKV